MKPVSIERNTRSLGIAAALAACLLGGCAVGPDYHRPDIALTPDYVHAAPAPQQAAKTTALENWWQGFDDAALLRVVERVQAQNLDLEQARARVLQSRAAARAAGAALLPNANASASAHDVRQSLLNPIGEIGRELPGFARGYDDYAVGAAASWEIDLFGGLRRGREAALADAKASAAQALGVQISVTADAADAYLQVRAYQARLGVARHQEQVQRDLVDLVSRRNREGVASDRELNQVTAALEGVAASIPPLLVGLDAQLNRLDVLMGAQPGTYRDELLAAAPIPAPPLLASHDGPAELLRRRPDVLAAEQRLMAASARIGAAIADYYPKLSLSALFGVESLASGQLSSGQAVAHDVGLGLRWRLFDFGRVDAEVAQTRGREAEALATYRATVLRATEEVENALSELVQDNARAAVLERQIVQLTRARTLAQQSYDAGVINLIEVRDTDRDLLTASDQLAQARAGAARAAIASFRALGGGWQPERTHALAMTALLPAR
ncbi:MAG: efflux transporter outer membrane subunit [Dokdonella sp.]